MDCCERVLRESGAQPEAQIRRAWQLALGSDPSPEEIQKAAQFLKQQTTTLQAALVSPAPILTAPAATSGATTAAPAVAKPTVAATTVPPKPAAGAKAPPSPAQAALATLCQALLNSNAFLYID